MQLNKILSLVSLLLCLHFSSLQAQRSIRYTESNYLLREAVKYVDIQYYQQAYILLNKYLNHFNEKDKIAQSLDYQTALYYFNMCALKTSKPFAEDNFNLFLKETPFQHLQQSGHYQLASHYYKQSNFESVIVHYEASGIDILTNKELTKRNFELGYSYLVTQRLEKVEPYFQSAKNIPGDYFTPGNYYHGLLCYYKKNYSEARESFNAVKDDERYKKIIPFYLIEMDYLTGQKEKALSTALQYLNASDKLYYHNELNNMVAQIYCEQENFANAELYFLKSTIQNKSMNYDDYFKLGYCQYQQGKIKEAIPNLETGAKAKNETAVHCLYLLALCHLKNDDKAQAFELFLKSKNENTNEATKELIDFTLAKLSYDTGNDKDAFLRLNSFVKKYPNADNFSEANELLSYLNIKYENFTDAIIAMNKMKNISFNLKKIYQKANFARGIQLLIDENPDRAIFNFQETKKFPIDENIVSLADFWLSECNYRLGRHAETMANCEWFLNNADTNSMAEYTKKIHLTKSFIYFNNNENEKFINEYSMATGETDSNNFASKIGTTKANYIPEKIPVIDNDPYVLVYNLPEEKIDFAYKPIPLKPLAISSENKRDDQTNFVKFSVGNLSSLDFATGYNLDYLVNRPLYLDFNHSTNTGKIKFQQVNHTHFGAFANTKVNNHSIDFSFAIDRNKLNYFGFDKNLYNYSSSDVKQIFNNIGIGADLIPLLITKYGLKYKANFYTGLYTDKWGAGEYSVKVNAPFSKQLKSDLTAHTNFIVDANAYFVKSKNTQSNSMIEINPFIVKQLNLLKIKAGLKLILANQFYLLPDILLQYPINNRAAIVELTLQSNIQLNTFKQLTELNPFINNYFKVKQSKNTEALGGIKGNIMSNCSYLLRAGIGVYDNLPLFLNDTAFDNKQFNVLFDKQATAFLFDAAVDYTINSEITTGAKLNLRPILHLTTYKEAWHYVPSVLNIYGKIRATKDVIIQADLFLNGGSKSIEKNILISNPYTKSLASGIDMNLSARYEIDKKWNAFIDINNLLGSKYQRWYGYPMYGANVKLGVIHTLPK